MESIDRGVRWAEIYATPELATEGIDRVRWAILRNIRRRVADSLAGESWDDVQRAPWYLRTLALYQDDIHVEWVQAGLQRTPRPVAAIDWATIAPGTRLRVGYRVPSEAELLARQPHLPPAPTLPAPQIGAIANDLQKAIQALNHQVERLLAPPGLIEQPSRADLHALLDEMDRQVLELRELIPPDRMTTFICASTYEDGPDTP